MVTSGLLLGALGVLKSHFNHSLCPGCSANSLLLCPNAHLGTAGFLSHAGVCGLAIWLCHLRHLSLCSCNGFCIKLVAQPWQSYRLFPGVHSLQPLLQAAARSAPIRALSPWHLLACSPATASPHPAALQDPFHIEEPVCFEKNSFPLSVPR